MAPAVVAVLVSSLLAVIYCWRIVEIAWFGTATTSTQKATATAAAGDAHHSTRPLPAGAWISLGAASILVIYLGLHSDWLVELTTAAGSSLLGAQ